MDELEYVVIRQWAGFWKGVNPPDFSHDPGGFVLTHHRGNNPPHKVEHYDTLQEIIGKYPQYAWIGRDTNDEPDVILVGI